MKRIADIKGEIAIFVISDKQYASKMKELVSSLSSDYKRICYVSVNKPYSVVLESIKKYGADPKKFFFVDCTEKQEGGEKGGQVVFVSSPKALTEMSITISKVLELGKIEVLVFDSLSTLLMYEEPSTVVKFVHSLISTLRAKKAAGILVCLEGGKNAELTKDISMFADSTLTA
jgi:KaiC/GvpD/RAD55 family RecA-like ATPase